MTVATEVLGELQRRGVIVAVEGDTLCLRPRRALDDALLARVREAKPAILETLRNRPATCSPEGYEVEAGVWIHHQWAGCTTVKPEANTPQRKVAVTCWHCHGENNCSCMACWETGGCITCKGRGQVRRWVQ